MYKFIRFLLCVMMLGGFMLQNASALERPSESHILEISGKIEQTNSANGTAVFDRMMLENLPAHTITTQTPWTDGLVTFEGVRIKDLLNHIGARGSVMMATAANDYSIDIPQEDITKYDVIVAYKMNGHYMSLRTRGPLWIIYPWEQHPKLKNELYHSRAIWQLRKLELK